MNKNELLYHWENKLTLIDVAFDNAIQSNNIKTSYGLAGQKSQLISCIEELKQLNETTVKRSEEKTCHTNSLCSLRLGCEYCLDCDNYY